QTLFNFLLSDKTPLELDFLRLTLEVRPFSSFTFYLLLHNNKLMSSSLDQSYLMENFRLANANDLQVFQILIKQPEHHICHQAIPQQGWSHPFGQKQYIFQMHAHNKQLLFELMGYFVLLFMLSIIIFPFLPLLLHRLVDFFPYDLQVNPEFFLDLVQVQVGM